MLLWHFDTTTAEVDVTGYRSRTCRLKDVWVQAIGYKSPLLFILEQTRLPQYTKVMRCLHHRRVELTRHFTYGLRTRAQTLNDPQSFRISNGSQESSAASRIKGILHP